MWFHLEHFSREAAIRVGPWKTKDLFPGRKGEARSL